MAILKDEPILWFLDDQVVVNVRGSGDANWRRCFNVLAADGIFDLDAMGMNDKTVIVLKMPREATQDEILAGLREMRSKTTATNEAIVHDNRYNEAAMQGSVQRWWAERQRGLPEEVASR